nr:uncharacterized protein LOC115126601 [Oncorhynchus nerka]
MSCLCCRVRLANPAKVVNVDLLVLRELVDSQELPVCLESRATEVIQVWMDSRERVELLVLRVSLVLPVRMALQDQWDHAVCPVREVVPDPLVLLALVVMTVCLALLVLLAQSVLLVLQASPALQVQREKLAPPVLVDLRALRDPVESQEPLDLPDPPAHLVTLVRMVLEDLKDPLVLLVRMVAPGPRPYGSPRSAWRDGIPRTQGSEVRGVHC